MKNSTSKYEEVLSKYFRKSSNAIIDAANSCLDLMSKDGMNPEEMYRFGSNLKHQALVHEVTHQGKMFYSEDLTSAVSAWLIDEFNACVGMVIMGTVTTNFPDWKPAFEQARRDFKAKHEERKIK